MGLVRLAGLEIVIRVKFAVRVNDGPRPRSSPMVVLGVLCDVGGNWVE